MKINLFDKPKPLDEQARRYVLKQKERMADVRLMEVYDIGKRLCKCGQCFCCLVVKEVDSEISAQENAK